MIPQEAAARQNIKKNHGIVFLLVRYIGKSDDKNAKLFPRQHSEKMAPEGQQARR